ncbi:MAG: ComEC/Rec2 family competence protein, partial [Dehalococcoidia bacterium]
AVMGGIAVLAMRSGRPHGGGTALLFAAAALTLEDPRILNDLSFQLSFAATAGLVVLTPPMLDWGRQALGEEQRAEGPSWRSLAYATWETLAVTLAATAATLPLLLVSFGRISLVAPLANLAMAPLFPALLVSGALGTATAMVLPSAATIVLAPVGGLLDLSMTIARWCAAVPGASVPLRGFTSVHAALLYALLALAALGRLPGRRPAVPEVILHPPAPLFVRPLPFLAFAPAVLLAVAVGSALAGRESPSNETRVEVFSLPGVAVALVTLPGGGRVLVDTGLAPGEARAALDRALPAGTPLAAIVITRDAPSASNGLPEVLGRYRTGVLLIPPEAEGAAWVDAARSRGVLVATLRPRLTIGDGRAHLEIGLGPEAGRWLVRVRHGARAIALSGAEEEAGITRSGQQTSLYVQSDGSRLSAPLRTRESATLTTNGSGLRLRPPVGRPLTYEACSPTCVSQDND